MPNNKKSSLKNPNSEDKSQFWENRYTENDTGWDLEGPTP